MNAVLLERPVHGSTVRALMPVEPQPCAAGEMQYPADTSAPASARAYANWFLCHCRDVPATVASDAVLVVSEMVTNAYIATTKISGPAVIGLSLRLFQGHLLIEAIDASPEPPVLKRVDVNEENGRGLQLVDMMSSEWGYFMHGNRKIVYCKLTIPASERDTGNAASAGERPDEKTRMRSSSAYGRNSGVRAD